MTRVRILKLLLAFVGVAALIAVGLFQSMVVDHDDWLERSYRNRWAFRDVPTRRGWIRFRNGEPARYVRVVAQGRRADTRFSAKPHQAPNGRRYLWIGGGAQAVDSGPDTDCTVNIAGYTSVTPMQCDLTAHDTLAALQAALG